MAEIARSRVAIRWDAGSPGVNTFYWSAGVPSPLDWKNSADQFHTELGALYSALAGIFITSCTWEVEQTFDVIDVATGNIVDQPVLDSAAITGTGTNPEKAVSRAMQAYFGYYTDRFEAGKRLRGGSFFGPIGGDTVDTTGQFSNSAAATFTAFFEAITTGVGPRLAVYHRPKVGGADQGYYGDVTSVRLKRAPATLRSRRD